LTKGVFSRTVKKLCKQPSNEEIMGQIKDTMVKLKCSLCSRITHYTKRNKKKVKEKLALNKYCRFCQKNAKHTESK
jgi:large subunit ribosomal protein L33